MTSGWLAQTFRGLRFRWSFPLAAIPAPKHFPFYPQAASGNNGNVMGVLDQDAFNNVGHTTTNTYDALNRLTSSVAAGTWAYNLTYTYDRYGNMQCVLNQNTNGLCPQWGVNGATNGLTSPYGYDAAGHMTGDGTHTYQYDAEGRLATVDGGSTVKYVYNALGQRVDSVASGPVYRETYYDAFGRPAVTQNHTLEDFFPPVGGRNFVKFGGDPSGETLYLHADAEGTTGIITNEVNGESQDQVYYPFGQQWVPMGGGYDVRFGSLEERDAATGFDPTPARQYTSTLGRWMTPDPENAGAEASDPQSWNAYSYAGNNPTTRTDPEGTDVHVCFKNENGGQDCNWYSDQDYAKYASAQNASGQGITAPVGNDQNGGHPNGNIMCGSAVCGTATWGEAPSRPPDLGPIDIGFLVAGGASLVRGAVDLGEGLASGIRGLLRSGEPVVQTLGIAGADVTAREVVNRAIGAVANQSIRVANRQIAEEAAEEFVGPGAKTITDRATGQVVGKISADGRRIYRTTSIGKPQPYVNLENKVTGGNLHVRF